MQQTSKQYDAVIEKCRSLYINKLKDYGPAWRVLRLPSLTDQIFIKVNRIRTLQEATERLDRITKQLYIQSKSFDEVVKMAKGKDKLIASITGHNDLKTLNQYYQVDSEQKKEAMDEVFNIELKLKVV